ncbi:hypothetical protein B0H17DRAFT_1215155 [Mycena rosella]|uniref:Uncharacterized protein n=1 Tax=Mycena rosella TaxID=1033263 RepID=A0AAD7CLC5_MYCRO|nr:hypothetical protein B0H17DRAFT_1215155 [Mycena rosella]
MPTLGYLRAKCDGVSMALTADPLAGLACAGALLACWLRPGNGATRPSYARGRAHPACAALGPNAQAESAGAAAHGCAVAAAGCYVERAGNGRDAPAARAAARTLPAPHRDGSRMLTAKAPAVSLLRRVRMRGNGRDAPMAPAAARNMPVLHLGRNPISNVYNACDVRMAQPAPHRDRKRGMQARPFTAAAAAGRNAREPRLGAHTAPAPPGMSSANQATEAQAEAQAQAQAAAAAAKLAPRRPLVIPRIVRRLPRWKQLILHWKYAQSGPPHADEVWDILPLLLKRRHQCRSCEAWRLA